MSGIELQRHLKSERNIDLPIIFVTAERNVQIAMRAFEAGAKAFLSKPFDGQDLLSAVDHAIRP
jgi:FixJ family two-component response regulator